MTHFWLQNERHYNASCDPILCQEKSFAFRKKLVNLKTICMEDSVCVFIKIVQTFELRIFARNLPLGQHSGCFEIYQRDENKAKLCQINKDTSGTVHERGNM